jgi:hypothetical protein
MKHSFLFLGFGFTALLLATACGGKTEVGGEPSVGGGAGNGGTAGSGGSGGTGAASGNGGSSTGGSSTGGSSTGGSSTGGSSTGGSGGMACVGGSPSWTSCAQPLDCTLVSTDCCHMECFEATLAQFAAVNTQHAQEWVTANCTPQPPCPGYVCSEADHKTYVRTAAQFGSTCSGAVCQEFDIRTSELSACTTQDDCILRWGTGCCESCSGSTDLIVAVSKKVPVYQVLCGNAQVDCCMPPAFPSDVIAMCGTQGHCIAAWAL